MIDMNMHHSWKPPIARKASTTRRYSISNAGISLILRSSADEWMNREFGGGILSGGDLINDVPSCRGGGRMEVRRDPGGVPGAVFPFEKHSGED